MEIRAKAIELILSDQNFKACVELLRDRLNKQILHISATPEDREKLVLKYHLLDELLAQMASVAQEANEENSK